MFSGTQVVFTTIDFNVSLKSLDEVDALFYAHIGSLVLRLHQNPVPVCWYPYKYFLLRGPQWARLIEIEESDEKSNSSISQASKLDGRWKCDCTKLFLKKIGSSFAYIVSKWLQFAAFSIKRRSSYFRGQTEQHFSIVSESFV